MKGLLFDRFISKAPAFTTVRTLPNSMVTQRIVTPDSERFGSGFRKTSTYTVVMHLRLTIMAGLASEHALARSDASPATTIHESFGQLSSRSWDRDREARSGLHWQSSWSLHRFRLRAS